VNLPRHPFRVNVGFLLNQPIGYNRDIHFEYPKVSLPPDLFLDNLKGGIRVSRTPQGILVLADFRAEVQMECVRCLVNFLQPLHAEFNELYAFNNRSTTESSFIFPEDGNIDLDPLVRECFLLEIPISSLCKPDCKGLCAVCGEDLNVQTCEHVLNRQTGD
jgi:uncharacterized protein